VSLTVANENENSFLIVFLPFATWTLSARSNINKHHWLLFRQWLFDPIC